MPPPRAPYPGALAAGAARRVGGRRASPGPWLRSWAVQLRAGPQRPGSGRPRGGRTAPGGAEPGRAGPRCALLPPPPPPRRASAPLAGGGGGLGPGCPLASLAHPGLYPRVLPSPAPRAAQLAGPGCCPFFRHSPPPPFGGVRPHLREPQQGPQGGRRAGGGGGTGNAGLVLPWDPLGKGQSATKAGGFSRGEDKKRGQGLALVQCMSVG